MKEKKEKKRGEEEKECQIRFKKEAEATRQDYEGDHRPEKKRKENKRRKERIKKDRISGLRHRALILSRVPALYLGPCDPTFS